ncbi:FMN-dependent NADH-azoreductase [Mycoplasmopsis caviae]|uniref:FMN-dependent NADH-azoreductase n=1 Tax=Mycoplasmopsis caviae TaxID=55603 RepID=A0A3P8MFB7_9BACT|nr:FMN-dependent NADH-azoreductase [Mycoplasmopsis caviae]UUD34898.1 FMN-dependent NADH-azoreductase [Mycoplasmopsis caviae]VDR42263.1 FMN-dependent NADH-azoreductase [Mycoplasmopsis caviae]
MSAKKIISILGSVNQDSLSNKINNLVTSRLFKKYPNSEITLLNLANSPFSKLMLNGKDTNSFWEDTEAKMWIERLKEADYVVINSPMINFNYSVLVKNFIDAICIDDHSFSYKYSKQNGSVGLLNKMKVILIGTQGAPKGWYTFGDHLKMLEGTFGFLGANKIKSLLVAGTKTAPLKDMSHDEIIAKYDDEINSLIEL